MIDPATRQFIDGHRQCDIHQLALQSRNHGDVDMAVAVEQIAGWQKARTKIPSWAAATDIVYPAHLSMEQCSSEQTARYKQQVCRRLLNDYAEGHHESMTDLTGGFGVDFAALCSLFDKGIYIEQEANLCACARHNFKVLGLKQAIVKEDDCQEVLDALPHQELIYADPARRDLHGSRTFAIGDCTPDVLKLLVALLQKADILMLKLSPMLDWHHTLASLNGICPGSVREIHIVAVGNDCKELLVVLTSHTSDNPITIYCVNDEHTTIFKDIPSPSLPIINDITTLKGKHLYEPHAAVMKAGCFAALAHDFGVTALGQNSHLFVSDKNILDFPGRRFLIRAVSTMNKHMLRQNLDGMKKANITVRNFPMSVADLRKRLRLADGGDCYIFATTIGKEHLLIICERLASS